MSMGIKNLIVSIFFLALSAFNLSAVMDAAWDAKWLQGGVFFSFSALSFYFYYSAFTSYLRSREVEKNKR